MSRSTAHASARSSGLPLTFRSPDEVLFRRPAGPVTAGQFRIQVGALARRLPEAPFALNLCRDRYDFAVALAAVVSRGQVNLLTSDRSALRLAQLCADYPGAYSIGEEPSGVAGMAHRPVQAEAGEPIAGEPIDPLIPGEQVAAIVFTSGSTGKPVGNAKPWAALVGCSVSAGQRFGFEAGKPASIVGTVPPQHMYGFETTVLLPLHAPASSYAGSTFFPQDVADALAAVPAPRVLVTTPLQIRALLSNGMALPSLDRVISATAPLAVELAREAEAAWGTRVEEIFGATEVGSIASRRTVEGDVWQAYAGVRLDDAGEETAAVTVPHLPEPVTLADRVEILGEGSFRLLGRRADTVKLAGNRTSLAGLNAILTAIPGVEDGAFLVPENLDSNPTGRLVAFAVAPGSTPEAILADLRLRVEAPFLPRRVVLVPALPRNEVGKVPRAALEALDAASRSGADGG